MIKTRFQQEISGELGEFWRDKAHEELNKIRLQLAHGEITIDKKGVARNKIGRVVMSDLLEKLLFISDEVNEEATKAAREKEVEESIARYKANYNGPSDEELAEMRAAFGKGTQVVNILTGETVTV